MSLSDFDSDLTDLPSSDEEEYIPTTTKKKKKATPRTRTEYKIQNALRPPRTTQYTAKSLYDQIVDDAIDLNPEYQRDVVWPETKQSGLIDSILRNYYIPPVIFGVDDGTERRTCIDGKQRLTSVQMQTNKRYWYKDVPGAKRTLLPKAYMQAFANKQITCVEYDCLTDDQEREIFQRVQLGVALTPAERMQAYVGPRASLIREVQSVVSGDDGIGHQFDWGRARGRDFQCIASIIYLIERHPNNTFPGAAQLDKWLQTPHSITSNFRTEVMDTIKTFIALIRDKRYSAAISKPNRVSPIEFTMIGILIHFNRNRMSLMQLFSAITKMRADVRGKHADIRANTKVTRTMQTCKAMEKGTSQPRKS
ncbi:uncharacterized protein LAESUDRAFT_738446 [Laetiporus sulphureus 93-53]|uniref:GmrSD restriction endonucleases N-terminal domain-containing protein n=1 Tax=Laetiporus sulphureus 93-53 TaxID=1314785 RepID=A0A165CN65_9APHY|nr:uncharacterized protein LAESUDRAFT_738446 [Laetiporus sulphureus 93-53]KZT03116.1 hypothetical protein LAESUDRAFT_738446 [Laetiporus sulphureus 93-53]